MSVVAGKTRLVSRGEDGFTLIELLVSMSIFGVFLAAVAGVFISASRSVADQRLRTAATRLASDRIETLRSLPFAELDAQAGQLPPRTIHGRAFTVDTTVTRIDAETGDPAPAGRVKRITAVVAWTVAGGTSRNVSYTTAVADNPRASVVQQAIGTITMFPSPMSTDAGGRPLENIDVTVPLGGFTTGTLVNLSWTNADGTAGAETLTSTTGLNWRGIIAKEKVRAAIGADGRGLVQFTVTAGTLSAKYDLSVQKVAADPPVITGATIDRNPVTVAKPAAGRTCVAVNQCQNTTEVVFTVTTTGLDPAQDSVVLQYQLYDSTYQEVSLAPVSGVSGQWRVAVRQKTTKFRTGTARAFRLTASRSADNATAGFTVSRDVVTV